MAEPEAFGETGMTALPIMLGGNVFGWTIDKGESFKVLDAFAAGGGSLIDSAEIYSSWVPGHEGGESETVMGEWLKQSGKRDRMLIATKAGLLTQEPGKLDAAYVTAHVDASLKRLQTNYIDIYFLHYDDAAVPQEDVLSGLDALVRTGKVRAIGASNYGADRLASALQVSEANGYARFTVLEPLYNLVERSHFEGALQDVAVREKLAVVPYYGLAAGFLTGKYRSKEDAGKSTRSGTALPYLEGKGPAVLAAMDAVAAETNASLAEIALAWLRAQPGITAPIASATSVTQVEQLFSGLELTLTSDQIARLDAASA